VRTLAFAIDAPGPAVLRSNVTYHCTLDGHDQRAVAIEAPKFKSPLLSVDLDGKLAGKIAFAPFRSSWARYRRDTQARHHRLRQSLQRVGILHNTNEKLTWVNPRPGAPRGVVGRMSIN